MHVLLCIRNWSSPVCPPLVQRFRTGAFQWPFAIFGRWSGDPRAHRVYCGRLVCDLVHRLLFDHHSIAIRSPCAIRPGRLVQQVGYADRWFTDLNSFQVYLLYWFVELLYWIAPSTSLKRILSRRNSSTIPTRAIGNLKFLNSSWAQAPSSISNRKNLQSKN